MGILQQNLCENQVQQNVKYLQCFRKIIYIPESSNIH